MQLILFFIIISVVVRNTSAALVTYGPTRYLQTSDSPWYQGIQNGTIYLEDFKDGLLNSPFVSANGRIRGPGDRRSVDADDGVLDGRGENGGTWSAGDGEILELSFDPNEENSLPAYVGIVMTKTARAFERISVSTLGEANLTRLHFDLTPLFKKSNANFVFDSSEAQFVGFYAPEGIISVTFESARFFDHLQYGYAVPEPGGAMLACVGFTLLVAHRRRPTNTLHYMTFIRPEPN